jgi:hypothetical protein
MPASNIVYINKTWGHHMHPLALHSYAEGTGGPLYGSNVFPDENRDYDIPEEGDFSNAYRYVVAEDYSLFWHDLGMIYSFLYPLVRLDPLGGTMSLKIMNIDEGQGNLLVGETLTLYGDWNEAGTSRPPGATIYITEDAIVANAFVNGQSEPGGGDPMSITNFTSI